MVSGGLFINYRRDDSAGWAGRLYDRAVTVLGSDRLFVDVEAIAPGEDFTEAIEEILDRVETVLVVIGPRWLEVRDIAGHRRIEDPADHVRREIEGAFARDLRVVPVLVGGALMPSEQELPGDIRPLARRNSVALRDTHFVADVDRLLDVTQVIRPAQADLDTEPTKFSRDRAQRILEHDSSLDLSIPTEANLEGVETSVPLELGQFVGREKEVRDVTELLKGRRLVTLTGPGGTGKSRLALEVARRFGHAYPDGVLHVGFSAVLDPDIVPQRIADVMGLVVGRGDALRSVLGSLAGKRTLFVLDNCEHLLDSTSTIAARIMRSAAGVSVMATSREPLRVAGEVVYRVPSLEIPPKSVSADDAIRYESVRLFVERASSAGASQIEQHLSAVAELCRELDGLPLAIELAAARADALSPAEILERIEDRFDLLRNDSSLVPGRHRSLQAAIDWSFELLDPPSRVLFSRLSVFEGGFDLAAAEMVCGFEPIEPASVANILSGLVAKSMVQATGSEWGTRYLMNQTVKRYASNSLEGNRAVKQVHASFFSRLARETPAHIPGPNEQAWIQRVSRDLDNLRAAMDWFLECGEAKEAQGLASSLHLFFLFSMRISEGLRWAERALAASDAPSAERVGTLLAAGILGNSVRHMTAALDLADALGMESILDSALYNDRTARLIFGENWIEAESLYRRSLESAEKRNDDAARAMALISLGYYALSRSDSDGALQLMTRSVDAAESSGSIHLQIWSRCGLLNVQRRNLDLEAASHTAAALAEKGEQLNDDPTLLAYSLLYRGAFVLDQNRFADAAEMIREAIELRRSSPDYAEDIGMWSTVLSEGSRLMSGQGDPSLGAVLIGAHGALIRGQSYVLRPYQIYWLEEAADASRKALTPEEFESSREKGQQLSPTEAIDLLLASVS